MGPPDDESRRSDRKEWIVALALALALHLGVLLVLGSLPMFGAASSRSDPPEAVQVMLLPETPENFTEQPPDRADQAPDNADLLSNVASRARDQEPDGDMALPRMLGDAVAPQVKLDRNQAPPRSPETPQQPDEVGASQAKQWSQPASDKDLRRPPGSLGNSDIDEPEMDHPDGNAGLTGDVSLSTTDWDYAPWIQRFGRELRRRWMAPQAYYLGLLKDGGYALIDLEITPSGKVLRLELVDQQGHPSLSQAAMSAVHAVNPIEPLPANFPDPTLRLRIRMIYPKYEDLRRLQESQRR